MRYAVVLEPVGEVGFEGFYYAHIPALDLTTHGTGVEGALAAAHELAATWVAEKRARGETVPPSEHATLLGSIEIADAVLGA
jgi:predicted RNase H-like HicB family nuclease